jgi:hypothetical protein
LLRQRAGHHIVCSPVVQIYSDTWLIYTHSSSQPWSTAEWCSMKCSANVCELTLTPVGTTSCRRVLRPLFQGSSCIPCFSSKCRGVPVPERTQGQGAIPAQLSQALGPSSGSSPSTMPSMFVNKHRRGGLLSPIIVGSDFHKDMCIIRSRPFHHLSVVDFTRTLHNFWSYCRLQAYPSHRLKRR